MSNQRNGSCAAGLLYLAVGLAGCGGGGGGDGDGGAAVPSEPIPITSANAVDVASATLGATGVLSDFDAGSIIGVASTSGTSGAPANVQGELADIVSAQLKRFQALLPHANSGVTVAVVVPPETFDCLISGTLTVSGEIADPNTLTDGDQFSGTFSHCDDGDGVVISGTLRFTIQNFTGDLFFPPYSLIAATSFTDFSLTEAGETLTVNGTVTFSESTQDGVFFTSNISSTFLSFTESTGDAGTLSDFTLDGTDDLNTLEYTVASSGTLATVELGGSVQYETTTTFRGVGDNFPFVGVMFVRGADGSSETITAVDSINVSIDIDQNGDGTIDETIATTWNVLL